jgi:hypothetical protein
MIDRKITTLSCWSLLAIALASAPGRRSPTVLSLEHATLLNPGVAAVPNANVVVRDDKISCTGSATECPRPAGATAVDLSGMYLAPGLIDAHVHYSQTGWVDGRPDAADVRREYPYDSVVHSLAAHPDRFHRADLRPGPKHPAGDRCPPGRRRRAAACHHHGGFSDDGAICLHVR